MTACCLRIKEPNETAFIAAAAKLMTFIRTLTRARQQADWHPHDANLLSGRRSCNARCEIQPQIQAVLCSFNLSFIPNNSEVRV